MAAESGHEEAVSMLLEARADVNAANKDGCSMHSMHSMHSMRGGLFSVVEGPCKRYAVAQYVCQATSASLGRRQSVSPKGDHMNKMRGSTGGWPPVQVEPTQSEQPTHFPLSRFWCSQPRCLDE